MYVATANGKIYGPFKTPAAAAKWAIKQLSPGVWAIEHLRDPRD